MVDRKVLREIIGYTYTNQLENPALWHKEAVSYREASQILYKNKSFSDPTAANRLFCFNAAMSLELILKAILTSKQIIPLPKTHNLRQLSKEAKIELDEDLKHTLDILTEYFAWLSRYPVPTSEERWDDYHDNILEKHKIRLRSGNTQTVLANQNRFPSMENYTKLWEICVAKYNNLSGTCHDTTL